MGWVGSGHTKWTHGQLSAYLDETDGQPTYHTAVSELSCVAGCGEVEAPLVTGVQVAPVNEALGRLHQHRTCTPDRQHR